MLDTGGVPFIKTCLIQRCESKEKFYKPILPEIISCIGKIDIYDTLYYMPPNPDLFHSINIARL